MLCNDMIWWYDMMIEHFVTTMPFPNCRIYQPPSADFGDFAKQRNGAGGREKDLCLFHGPMVDKGFPVSRTLSKSQPPRAHPANSRIKATSWQLQLWKGSLKCNEVQSWQWWSLIEPRIARWRLLYLFYCAALRLMSPKIELSTSLRYELQNCILSTDCPYLTLGSKFNIYGVLSLGQPFLELFLSRQRPLAMWILLKGMNWNSRTWNRMFIERNELK
jgi:hypothetical protein